MHLEHHGIKGQRWGIKRGPPYPLDSRNKEQILGKKNLKRAKTANLNKWGQDEEHNILYITGYSGSGKTTLARSLAGKNTDIIYLDAYYDDVTDQTAALKNRAFNKLLRERKVKIPVVSNKSFGGFEEALQEFGRQQYDKGHTVIAEGIQVADEGLYFDKNFYKDQPIIVAQTSAARSFIQRLIRDQDRITSISQAKSYLNWYMEMNGQLKVIESVTNVKKGEEWVRDYLEIFK